MVLMEQKEKKYTDILLEVLYADDNDFDLSNGTPNDGYC